MWEVIVSYRALWSERTKLCFNLTVMFVQGNYHVPHRLWKFWSWNAHFIQELLCRRLCEGTGPLWGRCDVGRLDMAQVFQPCPEAMAHGQTAWFCSTSGAWEEPGLKMGAWKDLISCPSQELLLLMVMSSALSLPPCSNPQECLCL